MNLILLAAGKSSRIYNKIKKNKCLIKINNKSLIRNIIDNSSGANISEINIITGFKPQNIKNELKGYNKIKFTNNSKYKTTDMVYSSIIGLKKSKSDTIISYTDIVYTKKLFQIIKNSNKNFITIPYIKNWKSVWKKRNKNILKMQKLLMLIKILILEKLEIDILLVTLN